MTPLRQRFVEDMQLRNFAPTTQRSYVHYVADFARYFNRSPEQLDLEAVRQYQLHMLQERKLSPQSVNTFVSAVQFLYLDTLEMPWNKQDFPRTRMEEKLPVVPGPDQVRRLFEHVPGIKNRAAPMVCFGAGLRVSEAVSVKIAHIESARMLLRVEHGKGGKKTATPPCRRLCWRPCAPTSGSFAPPGSGGFPPGVRIATSARACCSAPVRTAGGRLA